MIRGVGGGKNNTTGQFYLAATPRLPPYLSARLPRGVSGTLEAEITTPMHEAKL